MEPVSPAEWDFRKVEPRYAETCFVYEMMRDLARADERVMQAFENWRKRPFKNRTALQISAHL